MNTFRLFCLLLLIPMLFSACRKDDPLPADPGYDYFPANPGHFAVYRVDSVSKDPFTEITDTFQYQIMERIESEFTDNEGRLTLRIERFIRMSDTNAWIIKNVWFANRTTSAAERVEENIRYIKLVFPPRDGTKWNGNAFNNLGEEIYSCESPDRAYDNGLLVFDSTVTVLHRDITNAIQRRYGKEVYARHVGMVYKKFIDTDINSITGDIISMRDYSYTLMAWGN